MSTGPSLALGVRLDAQSQLAIDLVDKLCQKLTVDLSPVQRESKMSGRLPFIVALLLFTQFLALSCKKEEGGEEEKETGAAADEVRDPPEPGLLKKLAVDSKDGAAVELRYRPSAVALYRVEMKQRNAQTQAGKTMEVSSRYGFEMQRTLVQEEKAEWVEEVTFGKMEVELDWGGASGKNDEVARTMRNVLQSARFKARVNRRGELLGFESTGVEAGRWKGMSEVLKQFLTESAVPLPEKKVAPGESWSGERDIELTQQKTESKVLARYTSTFLGWTDQEVSCDRCAVIRTAATFTLSGKSNVPGVDGIEEGSGKSDSVAVMDVERGLLVRASMTSRSSQRFTLQGRRGKMAFRETKDMSMDEELVEGADNE